MANTCNYPIQLKPLLRRYLWGGRRLESVLGKSLGEGDNYAESWEVVDHGEDQSVVLSGAVAGRTLQQLVSDHPVELLGKHAGQSQFPLLLKFLDCNRTLSVQVHPNDEQAAQLDPPDLGKTEAWIVLCANPGSKIYAGLKPGVTRDDLRKAVEAGTCDRCLHQFQPQVGDCVFIEAGTVHALGAGLLIAEIQQASDTTFRLFDWNRVDAEGNARPLHAEQSLATIDFSRGPIAPQRPVETEIAGCERCVECDQFVLDRHTLEQRQPLGGDERFHLITVVEGAVELQGVPLTIGETCLLPAAAGPADAIPSGKAVLLDCYLPL